MDGLSHKLHVMGDSMVNLEAGQQGALCEEVGLITEEAIVITQQLIVDVHIRAGQPLSLVSTYHLNMQ